MHALPLLPANIFLNNSFHTEGKNELVYIFTIPAPSASYLIHTVLYRIHSVLNDIMFAVKNLRKTLDLHIKDTHIILF